jgi:hypothetical protein
MVSPLGVTNNKGCLSGWGRASATVAKEKAKTMEKARVAVKCMIVVF